MSTVLKRFAEREAGSLEIKDAVFFDGERFRRGGFSVRGGLFADVRGEETAVSPPEGEVFVPGLVDVHIHGAAGRDFCDGDPAGDAAIGAYLARHGVTSYCVALMACGEDELCRAVRVAVVSGDEGGARLLGVYFEGPFLSPAKCGAQNRESLVSPEPELFFRLSEAARGRVAAVCVAPELPGAMGFIREASRLAPVSLAHTEADYGTAAEAFRAGATRLTHCFNTMPPLLHREPGPVAAAMDAGAYAELICDGVHVHPAMVRAAFRLFGAEKVCVVSDSMRAAGEPDGVYELGGRRVAVRGKEARTETGALAGSVTDLHAELLELLEFGIAPADALRACTGTPARSVGGGEDAGAIVNGFPADLVLLDREWNIKAVWRGGRAVV